MLVKHGAACVILMTWQETCGEKTALAVCCCHACMRTSSVCSICIFTVLSAGVLTNRSTDTSRWGTQAPTSGRMAPWRACQSRPLRLVL